MITIRLANLFVEEEKPWVLAKQSPENPQLINMLNLVFETLRATSIIMQPIVPNLSSLVLGIMFVYATTSNNIHLQVFASLIINDDFFLTDRLNILPTDRSWRNLKPFLWDAAESNNMINNKELGIFKSVFYSRVYVAKAKA